MDSRIVIQEKDFDTGEENGRLHAASRKVGGICTFVGTVRDLNENDDVSGLFLEHYPGMTERQIGDIIERAAARWSVLSATVIHRVGQLQPGDQIVFVGVGSAHRGEAFDACEFIIDFLKTEATFWKKETTADGDRWLTTRDGDLETVKAWDAPD